MLNTLKTMLMQEYCKNKEEVVQDLELENKKLQAEKNLLKTEKAMLQESLQKTKQSLDSALDEIVWNQKRIDSLLRQLKDKNGGD